MSLAALALLAASPPASPWTLVFADEFTGPRIDRTVWTLADDCWGGGNDERQCYSPSKRNAAIVDGKLVITAQRGHFEGPALPLAMRDVASDPHRTVTRAFSSARLSTRGKAAWRYGKIEVRARLPQGQGTWPAIWMLPESDTYGPWAASGEIDILEAVNLGVPCASCPGGRESTILGTLHFGGKWPANTHKGEEVPYPPVLDGGFHTYSIEWDADAIVWRVDGRRFATRLASEWSTAGSPRKGAPFDRPFHLILNLAIGGRLAEQRGLRGISTDGFPKRMEVDWVRVWQCAADRDTGRACTSAGKGTD
ncbi:beta-glucanase (GH16 family) [Novosphingobium kunmingense]|uniref:Beta-glucanase (GH16 family) n=1 Tax=Novosphingobium kunmingense TaxID=1211806 RepID=A0A2N0H6C7_9SPHN|nr:glycoside hydrolase family 16 protein [Novosphingobium kunmingense]PKB14504.1 beta-glucanase (GH16 family) [Novosphingobium kunmingense]